jgi:hypothetical protein
MRALRILYLALVTSPYVGTAAEPDAPPTPAPPAAPAVTAPLPDNIRTVTLDDNERRPVCKRIIPTGSRIAEQRCESPPREPTAADRANRDILRRDVEAMRDQQMMREQARQLAMMEALRRRASQ